MKSFLTNRFQRVFILPVVVILACLFIGMSWWTIQLQISIAESELNRVGTATVETLAKSSFIPLIEKDREELKNLAGLVMEKEAGILSAALINLKGENIAVYGKAEIKLPLDPDRLKFLKATEIHKDRYRNLYISPILDKQFKTIAVIGLLLSKENFNQMSRRANVLFTVIVLGVIGFNVFVHNILEREALRANQLERAYDDLTKLQDRILQQEKMAAIGRLASGVGHELRNPLGAIKNAIYYIKDALAGSSLLEKDPTVSEFIEVIETEIKNSTAIIADLLDYSKVGKLHAQVTDVHVLLQELQSILEVPPQIKLTMNLAKKLPQITADPLRLRQVFINLANNAVQAMPDGGELNISTFMESHYAGDEICVVFKDTGHGISKENLNKIFEPLFTTKDKGTGLGLAICSGIVASHGGKIEVESVAGKGSQFIVRLPLVSSLRGESA